MGGFYDCIYVIFSFNRFPKWNIWTSVQITFLLYSWTWQSPAFIL